MKAQEVVDRLNELAERLPRIVITMILQSIPIDPAELKDVNGWNEFGTNKDKPPLNITFNLGFSGLYMMNFVNLISGLCDDASISYKIDGEKVRFETGPSFYHAMTSKELR
jgi:hypothetical protein